MAYDEGLRERIRDVLRDRLEVTEKQMFGGVAFLARGNMCVGIVGDELMVRVGPDAHDECVKRPHARIMDFTGRPMRGFLFVSPGGFESDVDLEGWVERGLAYAISLPRKAPRMAPRPAVKAKRPPRAGAERPRPAKRRR